MGALDRSGLRQRDNVHIMVNGSTDQTLHIARVLAAADRRIHLHELTLADKASAWNDYVHRIAPTIDRATYCHIFLDADMEPSEGAFHGLTRALKAKPDAYGAAALPATGRSQRAWARRLLEHHYLSSNLYALTDKVLIEFRRRRLRLPFGAKAEDGILSYLLLTDLKGELDDTHRHRIVAAADATFEFRSLRLSIADVARYHRQLMCNSERYFQTQILFRRLKQYGVRALPDSIFEIYEPEALGALRARHHPLYFWYDTKVLRRLREVTARPVFQPLKHRVS